MKRDVLAQYEAALRGNGKNPIDALRPAFGEGDLLLVAELILCHARVQAEYDRIVRWSMFAGGIIVAVAVALIARVFG